jgi:hypothetical protein
MLSFEKSRFGAEEATAFESEKLTDRRGSLSDWIAFASRLPRFAAPSIQTIAGFVAKHGDCGLWLQRQASGTGLAQLRANEGAT